MSGETYETYLRPILERMPVKPERVSAVNGPLMNVVEIDDETLGSGDDDGVFSRALRW